MHAHACCVQVGVSAQCLLRQLHRLLPPPSVVPEAEPEPVPAVQAGAIFKRTVAAFVDKAAPKQAEEPVAGTRYVCMYVYVCARICFHTCVRGLCGLGG